MNLGKVYDMAKREQSRERHRDAWRESKKLPEFYDSSSFHM